MRKPLIKAKFGEGFTCGRPAECRRWRPQWRQLIASRGLPHPGYGNPYCFQPEHSTPRYEMPSGNSERPRPMCFREECRNFPSLRGTSRRQWTHVVIMRQVNHPRMLKLLFTPGFPPEDFLEYLKVKYSRCPISGFRGERY